MKKKFTDGTNTSPKKFHIARDVGRPPAMPSSHTLKGAVLNPIPSKGPIHARGLQRTRRKGGSL